MNKSFINQAPSYFDNYIAKVPDVSMMEALENYGVAYVGDRRTQLLTLGDAVYSENKWTIKQILQHIIDTERVFQYRAMRFARRDDTRLPGFDENLFAEHADVSHRSIDDLLEEFDALRKATIYLFKSLPLQDLLCKGICANFEISTLSLAYMIAGHCIHHVQIIEERYYPLLEGGNV